ncbi:MAG: response regulator transcription factor [Campylobacterales bacterium]|nr:response regulator transcription factor [Campylobacterales bacterium]
MNLLIVDDEPLALARLERLLNTLGYSSITSAQSGVEALELAETKNFDLAFLDISMSDMDGIELGYALRYRHSAMAIIYQSAYENYALKAFDVGALGYLLKPYTAEALARAIERVTSTTPAKDLRLISKAGDEHYLLRPEEIFYIKADLTEVIFRSKEGFSYYPKKISELQSLLESHAFVRVHRSYLINLDRIKEMQTIEQSRIRFSFKGISESIESSKDGAKTFRQHFKEGQ